MPWEVIGVIVAIAAVIVGFLGLVAWIINFIVGRSEGRINKKVDEAQVENRKAHEGIVRNVEASEKRITASVTADVNRLYNLINTLISNRKNG